MVLTSLFPPEIVRLDGLNSCLSGHYSAYEAWTEAAGTDRVGDPCCVPANDVAVVDEAVVLVSNRDLPGSRQIAVVTQWLNILEAVIRCQPILQEGAERLRASLLLNS